MRFSIHIQMFWQSSILVESWHEHRYNIGVREPAPSCPCPLIWRIWSQCSQKWVRQFKGASRWYHSQYRLETRAGGPAKLIGRWCQAFYKGRQQEIEKQEAVPERARSPLGKQETPCWHGVKWIFAPATSVLMPKLPTCPSRALLRAPVVRCLWDHGIGIGLQMKKCRWSWGIAIVKRLNRVGSLR